MDRLEKIVVKMKESPKGVRFADLQYVCNYYFGNPRINGSHHYYKTPWEGEPLVNIQNDKGMAKGYQVKQVLKAIEKVKEQ